MTADSLDNRSLPAWLYNDPEFFGVEMERVLRPSWQVVCHVSEIAGAGDWQTLEFLGESIIVIRSDDGNVRAFANVCRHRASRLVDGTSGCAKKLVCPYHAWVYETDGRLTGVPFSSQYAGLDKANNGLFPVEHEIWHGFVFIRLQDDGGPSVAAMMAPHDAEIAPYRFDDLRRFGKPTLRPRAVNWKNVGDNYSDALHVPFAHPGLKSLFGQNYIIEAGDHVDRLRGHLHDEPRSSLSEHAYHRLLPRVDHLPESHQDLWLYFKLWPNIAFDIYPDQVDFMQWLPLTPTTTLIREMSYAIPDDRREMKAVRYLNWRINRQVNAEDTALISRVQAGMASRYYTSGPLGESEVCLKSFARRMRNVIPEARLDRAPAPGWSRK